MANKKISELASYTTPKANDLLLISDVVAHESKKLTLADLGTFVLNSGNITASVYGTASYALVAMTASFVTSSNIYGVVSSASWSPFISVITVPSASWVSASAFIITAQTASYITASNIYGVVSSASFATTASYALNGGSGGTSLTTGATYPITSSWAITASYALNGGSGGVSQITVPSASWVSASVFITTAQTASYLAFNGTPNGTASYAIFAGNIPNVRQDYGTFYAITQSVSSSQIDLVSVTPTFGGLQTTNFEVYGTVNVPFTSSVNGRLELFVLDRQQGFSQSLDFSPIYVSLGGNAPISGTLRYPVVLSGAATINGLYKVYITASGGVYFDPTRIMRYKITSTSDQLAVQSAEPTIFSSYPIHANMLYSSSLHPGVAYQGSASQVVFSGSYDVTSLLIPPSSVNILSYTWALSGLITMSVDNNAGLIDLGGIPMSCVSMSAANCGLSFLPDMSSGSLGYLNVPNNTIIGNLSLPNSMSYVNIAGNYYINFPNQWPSGMTVFIADGNGIVSTPYSVPNTLQTMSFVNCPNLTTWLAPGLPSSLTYWNSNNTPLINNFPSTMPPGLLYLDVTNNSLPPTTIGNIAAGLAANGLNGGYLSIYNNPGSASAFSIAANLATLQGLGWTVVS